MKLTDIISRIIAFLMIGILSPLLLMIISIGIVFHGRPIFFKQKRMGYEFIPFELLKFRTLNGLNGHSITIGQDERITRWGQFLRRWKLDELPQLINIIKGEMSFIGPRPEVPEFVDSESFSFLNKVKPGLSDYASILLIDESEILEKIHHTEPYRYILPLKLSLAEYYVERKGIMEDLEISFLTILAILFPKFASWWVIRFLLKDYFKNHSIDSLLIETVVKSR